MINLHTINLIMYFKPVISGEKLKWTELILNGGENILLPEPIEAIYQYIQEVIGEEQHLVLLPMGYDRQTKKKHQGYVMLSKVSQVLKLNHYPDRCLLVFDDGTDALCWDDYEKIRLKIFLGSGIKQIWSKLKETPANYIFV